MSKKRIQKKTGMDFISEDPWRVFRIMSEFVEGFEELAHLKNAAAVFGYPGLSQVKNIIN